MAHLQMLILVDQNSLCSSFAANACPRKLFQNQPKFHVNFSIQLLILSFYPIIQYNIHADFLIKRARTRSYFSPICLSVLNLFSLKKKHFPKT